MQEVDWASFNAKFSGREQKSFEWFCYLLFCQEFNRNLGIDRYSNHAGIETAPIEVDGNYYGWQAKYYTVPLSKKKKEFIQAIDVAKRNHPEITKIILFTNQEFGQGRGGGDPKGKQDIEAFAGSKGIELEWRTASFFESRFVVQDNELFARHFFNNSDKSIFDLIEELRNHTEQVLGLIHSEIVHNDTTIKIDRSHEVLSICQALEEPLPIIVSGGGGVGKTAIIKDLYDKMHESILLFLFKAAEFSDKVHVDELTKRYGDFTFRGFASLYDDVTEKCIVIDSAEKISDLSDQSVFQEFLYILLENNWRIIFTTRRSYLDDIKYLLVNLFKTPFTAVDLSDIPMSDLELISEQHDLVLPR